MKNNSTTEQSKKCCFCGKESDGNGNLFSKADYGDVFPFFDDVLFCDECYADFLEDVESYLKRDFK